ncbi:cobyrinate a,c-diamide synthase [Dactylosporangium sp. CS-033363]|uniref:cobyrinate a,c-diamide synthase n=1 Tax=Dactylosporangium sp. CS-033363 TaxID=3239935 RepID=UPI003D906D53
MSTIPRLVISAPSSGHGKTAVSVGLLAALSARGYRAAGFKIGPDHVDASYLGLAAGRPGRNLDPRMVGAKRMGPLFAHGAASLDIAVVEGTMGLFDGLAGRTDSESTAQISGLLRAPVILVVDVGAMGQSVAALVHGFRAYDELLWLGGVILNRVASTRHEQLLREALDDIGVPVLGALRRHALTDAGETGAPLPSRHHGVAPVVHHNLDAVRAVRRLGEVIAGAVDIDRTMALARSAPRLTSDPWSAEAEIAAAAESQSSLAATRIGRRPVIGVAFAYPETAELLTAAGAEVVPFDPLRDEVLPAGVDGLVIGAALPESYAEELTFNGRLRTAVAAHAAAGKPIAAEGTGLVWLCRDYNGRPMCGVVDASARETDLVVLGYREATARSSSVILPVGAQVIGHKMHRTSITPRAGLQAAWTWAGGPAEGFVQRGVHASYLGLHWAGTPAIASRFVTAAGATAAPQPGLWSTPSTSPYGRPSVPVMTFPTAPMLSAATPVTAIPAAAPVTPAMDDIAGGTPSYAADYTTPDAPPPRLPAAIPGSILASPAGPGSIAAAATPGPITPSADASSAAGPAAPGTVAASGVAGSVAGSGVAGTVAGSGVAGTVAGSGVAGTVAGSGVAGTVAGSGGAGSVAASGGPGSHAGSSGPRDPFAQPNVLAVATPTTAAAAGWSAETAAAGSDPIPGWTAPAAGAPIPSWIAPSAAAGDAAAPGWTPASAAAGDAAAPGWTAASGAQAMPTVPATASATGSYPVTGTTYRAAVPASAPTSPGASSPFGPALGPAMPTPWTSSDPAPTGSASVPAASSSAAAGSASVPAASVSSPAASVAAVSAPAGSVSAVPVSAVPVSAPGGFVSGPTPLTPPPSGSVSGVPASTVPVSGSAGSSVPVSDSAGSSAPISGPAGPSASVSGPAGSSASVSGPAGSGPGSPAAAGVTNEEPAEFGHVGSVSGSSTSSASERPAGSGFIPSSVSEGGSVSATTRGSGSASSDISDTSNAGDEATTVLGVAGGGGGDGEASVGVPSAGNGPAVASGLPSSLVVPVQSSAAQPVSSPSSSPVSGSVTGPITAYGPGGVAGPGPSTSAAVPVSSAPMPVFAESAPQASAPVSAAPGGVTAMPAGEAELHGDVAEAPVSAPPVSGPPATGRSVGTASIPVVSVSGPVSAPPGSVVSGSVPTSPVSGSASEDEAAKGKNGDGDEAA